MTSYGMTEINAVFNSPVHRRDAWRLDSAGLPVSDVQYRIVDPETGEDKPDGESGELIVRGPGLMAGYLPESANDGAFLDGWFRTGDIGWVEPGGWFHVTDRIKDMIKVSGFSVSPVEIEEVLLQHPDVADCAVAGIPDPRTGEIPVAVVVPSPDAASTSADLTAYVAAHLAGYKKLAGVRFVPAVLRSASGKTLRREIASGWHAAGDEPAQT